GESDPTYSGHRPQGPAVRLDRGAKHASCVLGRALGRSAHPWAQEAPGVGSLRGGEAASEATATGRVPLLPPGEAHRGRRRARRDRAEILRGAAGAAVLAGHRTYLRTRGGDPR